MVSKYIQLLLTLMFTIVCDIICCIFLSRLPFLILQLPQMPSQLLSIDIFVGIIITFLLSSIKSGFSPICIKQRSWATLCSVIGCCGPTFSWSRLGLMTLARGLAMLFSSATVSSYLQSPTTLERSDRSFSQLTKSSETSELNLLQLIYFNVWADAPAQSRVFCERMGTLSACWALQAAWNSKFLLAWGNFYDIYCIHVVLLVFLASFLWLIIRISREQM
jgi:hypothetical protein